MSDKAQAIFESLIGAIVAAKRDPAFRDDRARWEFSPEAWDAVRYAHSHNRNILAIDSMTSAITGVFGFPYSIDTDLHGEADFRLVCK